MGLFRSDDPQHPEPRVTLQLDASCKTPFHPGSNVFGQVFFDSPAERRIRNVEVIIQGTTTTKYVIVVSRGEYRRLKIHYHDEATLRTINKVIAQGLTTEPEHRYTWDFSLAFTHGTAGLLHPNPAKSPYKAPSGHKEFYASSPYQLPPSFLHMKSDEHMGQVQYTLTVQVNFEDQKKPYSPPLKILTYVPSEEPFDQRLAESVFHINSYSSSRLAGSSTKSGLARFKDKLASSSPTVKLSLKSTLPSSIVRGAAFPIEARLEVNPLSDPSVLSIPNVRIGISSIELVPLVIYRILRDRESANMLPLESVQCPPEQELVEEGQAVSLNAVPQEVFVEQQRDDKSEALGFPGSFGGRLPNHISPSFATTNIVLWWKLRVKLVANVGGKEFDDTAETRVMVISDVKS
ncbi:hypothetical protein M409DRAFT_29219 [Zasmidium cellare ATCC 36951]|uniref:Arrestin-like N-terminal domain-containing protein n=1 Tax=Zasmidium cellare ATCC 36951 TaxID=1080233 RepID=A0A6A6C021_ZASCE|nr:uncharacterized protein M409DRAFT_29219 [Zasmidium cellare ATCC 36951]KAF2160371.1 hypothetical protein M409DRAFT_29219 [Zasmidium cellare ATCC 36951]